VSTNEYQSLPAGQLSGINGWTSEKAQFPDVHICLKFQYEKLLDDLEALLYCDSEFDRQSALSLS
jgi:hypothetical protein